MKNNLLVAITSAVASYISEEESIASDSGAKSLWWVAGQRKQMGARKNSSHARPKPGVGMWRRYNLL
jgi:hypothetical protein